MTKNIDENSILIRILFFDYYSAFKSCFDPCNFNFDDVSKIRYPRFSGKTSILK